MLDLRASNVLPDELIRRRTSRSDVPVTALGDLNAAGGGYDFLLQATNPVVADAAFASLKLNWLSARLDAQAVATLRTSGTPMSPALQSLVGPLGTAGAVGGDILVLFSRKDVLFDGPTTCRIRADVRVALGRFLRVPHEPGLVHSLSPGEAVEGLGPEVVRLVEGLVRDLVQPARIRELQAPSPGRAVARLQGAVPPALPVADGTLASWGAASRFGTTAEIASYTPAHLDLGDRQSFDVTAWIGDAVLEIPAPFAAVGDQAAATIRVAADTSASTPGFSDLSGDAALLLSAADPAGLVATTTSRVRERGRVALLDDVSLGATPATANVNNLAQLAPAAFPCGQGASPLSVGATIVAWHYGTPTAIRFVGESGYGVLWSAEAVAFLVKYCWETNWFPRGITQTTPVKLTINGEDQVAGAESDIQLQTLKTVSLEYDSNGRTDVIHFGGSAQVIPRRFRLADGTELLPANPNDPLFAPGPVRPWAAIGTLIEQSPTGPTSDIVQFERAVTARVTARLGRPFAELVDRTVTFSRISAYAQRILLLAE
jgi:hypothetical protein